jgi:hypothetical protein
MKDIRIEAIAAHFYMAATIYPLHVPPRPWHTLGLDYFTHLSVSNGFDNVLIVVDHLI